MIRLDALYGKVLSKRRDRGLLQSLERQWSYDSIFLKAQRPLGDARCFVDTGIVAEVEEAERNAIWEDISSDSVPVFSAGQSLSVRQRQVRDIEKWVSSR